MFTFSRFVQTTAAAAALLTAFSFSSAHASLIVSDLDASISADTQSTPSIFVDVNNDGFNDIQFSIRSGEAFGPFAAFEVGEVRALEVREFNYETEEILASTRLRFSADGEAFNQFALGDSIGAENFNELSLRRGQLYNSDPFNTSLWLQEIGDSGYLAYEFTQFDGFSEQADIFYGFIELTRGSLQVGQVGFQSVASASFNITDVVTVANNSPTVEASSPATVSIVLGGLIALLFARTRRA